MEPQGWHRDRSGGAEDPGDVHTPQSDRYRFPEAVHCTAYYRDMVPISSDSSSAIGSTEIVSGSHLDGAWPSPNSSNVPMAQFNPRAEDIIVWDQRCWRK